MSPFFDESKNETSLRADVEKQLGSFSEGAFLITCWLESSVLIPKYYR